MFHHTNYPRHKIDLEETEISKEMQQKLQTLQQDYNDIVTKHSSDIELIHWVEMKIETDSDLSPVACKP